MNTKRFLILCLLIGMGLAVVSAQSSNKGDNRSISYEVQQWGWMPAYCDGFHEDLYSILDIHFIDHFKDGVMISSISQWKGETISSTGEVFKHSEFDKIVVLDVVATQPFVGTFHVNLNGDQGSHFILSGAIDYSVSPVIITIDKAVCLEKDK